MALQDFAKFDFAHDSHTRPVYRRGNGPGVVLLHVLPGMIPEVMELGRRVADAGFTAYLPHLFGVPEQPLSPGYLLAEFVRVCIRREFAVLAAHRSSPITDWLRALCRRAHAECGGPGIGAIGMCFTGGFALSMMVDPAVMAPVLCQPSLPTFPVTRARKAALGISREEFAAAKVSARAGVKVLGLRFTDDPLCPTERFDTLRREFGSNFESVEIDSSPGNPHGIPRAAHGVLTTDLVDREGHPTHEALNRVLALFHERLRDCSQSSSVAACSTARPSVGQLTERSS